MKKPDWETCTEEQLWKFVAWHLARRGIDSILVGGAVASIYSEGLYKSGDIDMITFERTVKDLDQAMSEIGFQKNGMHYHNPECPNFFIQSVSGPLGIGDDLNIKPRAVTVDGQIIRLLTPTDCIRDRLAAYIFDRVRSLFDQAVLVAKAQKFESKKIERWLKAEGHAEVFQEFVAAVAAPPVSK